MRLGLVSFERLPKVTKTLIMISVAGYLISLPMSIRFIYYFGLVPVLVTHKLFLWQLVTYMFLHGGLMHLALNMFMLWMFGSIIETAWGSKEFLKYFFITGIGAALLHTAITPNSVIPAIGASGAIFGILMAFGLMFPDARLYLYFLFPITGRQLTILLILMEFFASFKHNSHIANIAHLGGLLTGYVYIRWYPWIKHRIKSHFGK
jgi:rhomboid family protein